MAIRGVIPAVKRLLLRSVAIEDNVPAPVHLVNRHCYCTTWYKACATSLSITSKYGNVDGLLRTLEAICKYKFTRHILRLQITTGYIRCVFCPHWPDVFLRYSGLEKVLRSDQSINQSKKQPINQKSENRSCLRSSSLR